jgi:hypothetical protein
MLRVFERRSGDEVLLPVSAGLTAILAFAAASKTSMLRGVVRRVRVGVVLGERGWIEPMVLLIVLRGVSGCSSDGVDM